MHTTSNLCGTLPFSYWWYMKKVKCCFTYIHIWSSISATFVEVSKALWHIAHLVFFPLYLYTGQSVSTNLFFRFSFHPAVVFFLCSCSVEFIKKIPDSNIISPVWDDFISASRKVLILYWRPTFFSSYPNAFFSIWKYFKYKHIIRYALYGIYTESFHTPFSLLYFLY